MLKGLWALLTALPEILKLIEEIKKVNAERKVQKKLSEDVKKIRNAFEEKNAEKLNDIFNS